ncbi:hypothetical protein K488DRAFT_35732, partial [Vararia minispora EC-137]
PTSFPDPDRPDVYYHLIHPPSPFSDELAAFGVSFLSQPPPVASSSTVIGWLPAQRLGGSSEAGLNEFKENPAFRDLLHEAIAEGLAEDVDDIQRNGAIQLGEGWMHINDARNAPPLGRIGDPDDIIGSVRVEEGKILPETYQPMPSYRLCTSDGVTQLTEGLARRFRRLLEVRAKAE